MHARAPTPYPHSQFPTTHIESVRREVERVYTARGTECSSRNGCDVYSHFQACSRILLAQECINACKGFHSAWLQSNFAAPFILDVLVGRFIIGIEMSCGIYGTSCDNRPQNLLLLYDLPLFLFYTVSISQKVRFIGGSRNCSWMG